MRFLSTDTPPRDPADGATREAFHTARSKTLFTIVGTARTRNTLLAGTAVLLSALGLRAEEPPSAFTKHPYPAVARADGPCRDDAGRSAGPCRLLPLRGWAYTPIPHYSFVEMETPAPPGAGSLTETPLAPDAIATPAASNPQNVQAGPRDYRIGPGDVLQISVWREPEVSVSGVAVRSDGKISLPLVKEISVANLRPAELEQLLSQRFSQFINNPVVTVITSEIHSQKVFLIGGVDRPGSLELRIPMTVLQVLAEAGGLTEYAKRRKIYVLRKQDGLQTRVPFDYDTVIKGHQPELNFIVQPGDTIVVPE